MSHQLSGMTQSQNGLHMGKHLNSTETKSEVEMSGVYTMCMCTAYTSLPHRPKFTFAGMYILSAYILPPSQVVCTGSRLGSALLPHKTQLIDAFIDADPASSSDSAVVFVRSTRSPRQSEGGGDYRLHSTALLEPWKRQWQPHHWLCHPGQDTFHRRLAGCGHRYYKSFLNKKIKKKTKKSELLV